MSDALQALASLHRELVLREDGHATSPFPVASDSDWAPRWRRVPYQAIDPTSLPVDREQGFHEQTGAALDEALLAIIREEGPIHVALLSRRLLQALPTSRSGSRIRVAIDTSLARLQQETVVGGGDWLALPEQLRRAPHRDWSDLPDAERQLPYVHARELMQCLLNTVVRENPLPVDEAMNRALHGIGFIRFTAQAREQMQVPLNDLLMNQRLVQIEDTLSPGPRALLR